LHTGAATLILLFASGVFSHGSAGSFDPLARISFSIDWIQFAALFLLLLGLGSNTSKKSAARLHLINR
jgi:hypothetical protein